MDALPVGCVDCLVDGPINFSTWFRVMPIFSLANLLSEEGLPTISPSTGASFLTTSFFVASFLVLSFAGAGLLTGRTFSGVSVFAGWLAHPPASAMVNKARIRYACF